MTAATIEAALAAVIAFRTGDPSNPCATLGRPLPTRLAVVAMGALRIMWRTLSPAHPLGSDEEWTADE